MTGVIHVFCYRIQQPAKAFGGGPVHVGFSDCDVCPCTPLGELRREDGRWSFFPLAFLPSVGLSPRNLRTIADKIDSLTNAETEIRKDGRTKASCKEATKAPRWH